MEVRKMAAMIAIALAFVGCNQPSLPDPIQNTSVPSVDIKLIDAQLVKGSTARFQIDLFSPQDGDVQLSLTSPGYVRLNQSKFDLELKANEHQILNVSANFSRAGYFSITALANSASWRAPETSMLSFGVAPTVSTLRDSHIQAISGGVEDLETHLKTLPIDADGVLQTQQIIADLNGRDDVRLDSRWSNRALPVWGTKDQTVKFNTAISFVPDTGAGTPLPEELQKPNATKSKAQTRGWGCSPQAGTQSWVDVTIGYGGERSAFKNVHVSVLDINPWLNPTVVADGYTDGTGRFYFMKPNCDTGAFWDYSGADLQFIVSSDDSRGIIVRNIIVPIWDASYSVGSGVYWEGAGGPGYSFDLTGGNSDQENALWALKRIQQAEDFNNKAGGTGSDYFPLRIAWPQRIPFTNVSFAAVGKLELQGPDWLSTYTQWHEFGHELMYRTATQTNYLYWYTLGSFSESFPAFSWGTHSGYEAQSLDLAYNEGWANMYANLVWRDLYGNAPLAYVNCINDGIYTCSAAIDNNEQRVGTFLYRYINTVLTPTTANGSNWQSAFGTLRLKLWNVGTYGIGLAQSWNNWLVATLPAPAVYHDLTRNLVKITTISGITIN